MSYTVSAYLLDLNELQAVYGSGDANLVRDIEHRFAQRFTDNERYSAEPEAPTLREAMRELVSGKIRQPEHAWQYVHAMELLCHHLGVRLPNDYVESLRAAAIGVVGQLDGLRELNEGSRLPLPLPMPEDFPTVTYLTPAEAADKLTRRQLLELPELDWQEWATNMQQQYRSWLQDAVRTQKGIVAYLY